MSGTRPWRDRAAPIIAAALQATAGRPEKEIRKALKDAYPFGPREHWPYTVWLDEVKRQRGLKPRLGLRQTRTGRVIAELGDIAGQGLMEWQE